MNYYISDLHIGCENRFRPLEHDELIKKAWNETVTNSDTVYILGDIGKDGTNKEVEHLCSIVSQLKGNKVLIKGNHDKLKDARVKQLFSEICDYKEITDYIPSENGKENTAVKVVMSHYPILMWNGQHKGSVHIYGHLHKNNEQELYEQALDIINNHLKNETTNGRNDCPEAKAFNVYYRLNENFKPFTLRELLEME